ncbi:PepSY domain-containing protein [Xanthomonas nasturtii]|uniref:PepSY domain-containing protein n=1 Tax=Xanthomonas nasturtii TaxID=1843581 RepID=A0A3E1KF37_9XANT|nr:PepSY domain-containing protein [Xanthomonas nasturtii]MCL1532199.1 PepSY domain-containing protein [Xanthomonas nasturtii]MCL1566895.1 PepSY domain-containing protein [Xanthomonas nasturtii]MCL1570835.1 PepSY domain-containing protein [Xanthomonas nasturtii]MCL1574601.1 PepSY domain-containing protein [Xanthomonas nasturtii]MCL1582564.1 PepSY domain-containing protein [Xanthomonas nasturtii]
MVRKIPSGAAEVQLAEAGRRNRHRLFWRWHLYAGLFVAPFLLMLAVTGAIYLFNDELNDAIYPELRFTPAPWKERASLGHMITAAQAHVPGSTATRIDVPADPQRSAQVYLDVANAPSQIAFVNPGNAQVQGTLVPSRTLVGLADRLHGSLMLGTPGSYLIELAACWAVLLILSGLYLGWPRGQGDAWWHGVVPNVRAKGRAFWKSLHAATGLWISLLVLFLIFTGLPWASFWGGWVRSGAEAIGAGYPPVYRRYVAPTAPTVGTRFNDVPWTLQHAPMPPAEAASDPAHSHHANHATSRPGTTRYWTEAGLERAIAHVRDAGTTDPLRVFLPSTQGGALMVYTYPDRPQGQVTYHFDERGELLVRAGFDDYGVVAQAIEMGVQLHMGNYFGRANQVVMLFACVGIVVLCTSGLVMWWRRKPAGRIGAPGSDRSTPPGWLLAMAIATAIALPLLFVSLLVVWAFDRWIRPRSRLFRWLD